MLVMENFVTYELAVKLKEKGFEFDKENRYLYANGELCQVRNFCNISPYEYAPTISQVLKWLRKTHNLFIIVFINDDTDKPLTYEIYKETDCLLHHHGRYFSLEDWDKANLDAIKYAIDNLI